MHSEYESLWKVVENMPVIQFEEYKVKLNNILPTMDVVEKALNLDAAAKEIEELETASARPDFWNDVENSQKVQKRLKQLKDKTEKFASLRSTWDDMMTLCDMAIEENDDSMLPELETDYAKILRGAGDHAPVHPAHRGLRRQQRHPHLPRRRRRDRGPGLDPDALPHVQHVGRPPRLQP
jgi:hypothetical protein